MVHVNCGRILTRVKLTNGNCHEHVTDVVESVRLREIKAWHNGCFMSFLSGARVDCPLHADIAAPWLSGLSLLWFWVMGHVLV